MVSCNLRRVLAIALALTVFIYQGMNVASANTPILDNGKPGSSATGTWKVSGGVNPYGSNSLYANQSGASYTFSVNLPTPGEYKVFAWWTGYSNRRNSVPFDIGHLGGTSTVTVNQRQNGGQWNQLGSAWNFGARATITLRSLGNGTTSADAIMLVPVGTNAVPVVTVTGNKTVAAGNTLSFNVSAADSDGAVPVLSATGLPVNAIFIDKNNGVGTFTWPTTSSDTGNHNVTFVATDTSDPTVKGRKTVTISVVDKSANTLILDNGKPGSSATGTWKVSGGVNPYGSNSLYANQSGASYTFSVNLPTPGEYKVFAWWTGYSNRRNSVPFDIGHLGGTSTVTVNQRQNGGQWNQLGSAWNFGARATITLRSLGNGTTSADAIMLVPVGGTIGQSGNALFNVDFENRAVNTAYTDTHLIQDFNANTSDGPFYGPKSGHTRIVSDPAGTGRGNVLRVRHPAGEYAKGGASFKARFAPDNANKSGSARFDDVYFAYDIYLSPNTKRMPYHKLPGLITGTLLEASHLSTSSKPEPEGVKSFTASMATFTSLVQPNRPDGTMLLYYYDAQRVQANDFLDTSDPTRQAAAGSYVQPLGKWITIEQRVKLNTADSSNAYNSARDLKDGLAEIWINGVKMSSKVHLWRYTNTMKVDGFWFYDAYNNRPDLISPPSQDQYVYYDKFRVSTSPITH